MILGHGKYLKKYEYLLFMTKRIYQPNAAHKSAVTAFENICSQIRLHLSTLAMSSLHSYHVFNNTYHSLEDIHNADSICFNISTHFRVMKSKGT